MPLFVYAFEEVPFKVRQIGEGDLIKFYRHMFDTMQLATECVVISLIYLEQFLLNSGVEIRYVNWHPILFTSILTASKFWEDLNFWNIDYAEGLPFYPLKSINRMECEFLSLCEYNLFVDAEKYYKYFNAIREMEAINNPPKTSMTWAMSFNRFK